MESVNQNSRNSDSDQNQLKQSGRTELKSANCSNLDKIKSPEAETEQGSEDPKNGSGNRKEETRMRKRWKNL